MKRRSRNWNDQSFDRLESRWVPTVGAEFAPGFLPPGGFPDFSLPRLATTPADGASIQAADAPTALILDLGGPAAILWSDSSVELRRVAADNSETTVVARNQWGTPILAGNAATLTLPSKLEPGRYRIVLVGRSDLALGYSHGEWDPMADHAIAEFEVTPAAANADLGVVGPGLTTVSGRLEGTSAGANSYRIHLAAGTDLWQLTLQADADRIGSGLIAGLTVYDSNGQRVASAAAGGAYGADHPADPFLFAGLAPGDYVVEISKPAGGPGGDYALNLVATPVTEPTRASWFSFDRSESGAAEIAIAFTSPIHPASLRSDAVRVIDAEGAIHAVRLVSVGDGLTSARFELASALPAGPCRLVVADDQPLADLIGRVPVAAGLPSGTLASWIVSADEAGGAAAPGGQIAGEGTLNLAPGDSLDIPVTLGADESLVLSATLDSGAFRVELIGGPNGPVSLPSSNGATSLERWLRPGAGSFVIRIVAAEGESLTGSWRLQVARTPEASLVARALGSRGAIGLGMGETPTTTTTTTTSGAGAARPRTEETQAGRPELGPSPWAYGGSSALVGRPSANGDSVAAVGPAVPGGTSSLAWDGDASSEVGTSLILSSRLPGEDPAPPATDGSPETAEGAAPRDGEVALAAAEPDADDGALERAERIASAILGRLRWVVDAPAEAVEAATGNGDALALADAEAAAPEIGGSEGNVERSALDLPFTVLFVTATTFQLRRASRRWWRKRRIALKTTGGDGSTPASSKASSRGPHFLMPSPARPRVAGPRRG